MVLKGPAGELKYLREEKYLKGGEGEGKEGKGCDVIYPLMNILTADPYG